MKKAFLSIILLLLALPASAQVTFDSSTSVSTVSGTSHTLTGVVIGNNANRLLVLGTGVNFGTNTTEVTGCTFNTTETMTKLVATNVVGNNSSAYIWYRKAPSVTTASIVCTTSNSDRMVMGTVSLYNVDQTNTFRDSDLLNGTTGTGTGDMTLTTLANDYLVAEVHAGTSVSDVVNLVPGGSQNERWDLQCIAGVSCNWRSGGSTLVASGSSTVLSYSWSNNQPFSFVGAAVQSAQAPGPLFKRYYDLLRN